MAARAAGQARPGYLPSVRTPALPFLVVAGLELGVAPLLPGWLAWAPAWAGAATAWVGLAYLLRRPGWLGKGRALAQLALLPFALTARGAARAGAHTMRDRWKVELIPGLWVGGWPRRGAPGLAQLDLTAELPRRGDAVRYRCVPMLDGAPPEPDAWKEAVDQAVAWRAEGLPVLVHCAYGHGRSVAVCLGVLVAEGRFPTWEAAHAHVLGLRPRATMTAAQRERVATLAGGLRLAAPPAVDQPAQGSPNTTR